MLRKILVISLQNQQLLQMKLIRKSHAIHMGCVVVIQKENYVSHLLHTDLKCSIRMIQYTGTTYPEAHF